MTQTLRSTILRVLERGGIVGLGIGLLEDIYEDNKLTEVDRAFLTKWLATADDPIWSGILHTGQLPDIGHLEQ
jgi:hypothetical protein